MKRTATFETVFGRLVAAYRAGPAGAGEAGPLLAEAVKLAAKGPVAVEAGVFRSGDYDPANLRSHLLRRQVEVLTVSAGASAEILGALARALGGDAPLPEDPALGYEMVTQLVPDSYRPPQYPTAPPEPGPFVLMGAEQFEERDDRAPSAFGAEVTALSDAIASAGARGAWTEALHAAQALVRLAARVPESDRRTVSIAARRVLTRPLLGGIIAHAIRTPEEQPRAAEVLQWRGAEAAELMIEAIRTTESPAPHQFLLDGLGRMPDAVPMLLPMLGSPQWHEVRHAAEALGRQLVPEAVPGLRALVDHADARVRGAALESLSRYPAQHGSEAMRQGLSHPSADTRREAARAIGRRGGGALAMPLLASIEVERDPETWHAMVTALGRIEAPEAAAALSTLALRRRGLLSRTGLTVPRRLEVVAVLAAAPTRAARQALLRVSREAEGEVGAAARAELERREVSAGGAGR